MHVILLYYCKFARMNDHSKAYDTCHNNNQGQLSNDYDKDQVNDSRETGTAPYSNI